ncbi:hypothetical protein UFOVP916_2 [uncultured Caudovirales phage]|uniref:Uncharacterized protein n=1 Tax=uncultured Caudovirales phage TaxID=2100421 RepID=A0A6J5S2X8_9CAUD|nr:hypothetical protein UFOVP827_23 [uncultured Caudovirales phage]CAB4171412.1 hypothetical protein UFOVP916_2 [uncultured Caudovirales phage]CAB4177347.1 hypothetical protein UFOVP1001_26 [uncultured Caudovirales phage]CAB4199494.1 hypothetical protein UFOVP1338_50 [uncultured Caudovirales phage]CAB4213505.1 hypothetical protein UFOVP1447_45 [uncultured Caudovirales phage]
MSLEPKFHYINHENGKVATSYFSETYFNAMIEKRLLCEVIVPLDENKLLVKAKRVPFKDLWQYISPNISIKDFLQVRINELNNL